MASDRCLLPSALWLLLSVIACFLGTMTKEVIVTAPVMVLLYDRTFVAGSFRKAWRSHGPYYVGLVCALFPLVHITTTLGQRSVGFDLGVTWWTYALTSCRSIVEYCKLTVWPHPLVFDYGVDTLQHVAEALPYALILAAFLGAVALALRYRPVIGFAGAWFFLILAPASSIIPVAGQPMAEHRLYLSLAAAAALAVLGLHRLIGWRSLIVCAAVAAGLGWLSEQRNNDYRSELAIWNDTVSKSPDNARAHNNLATVLLKIKGRELDAVTELHTALQIKPDYAEAHYNLAQALAKIPGHQRDTLAEYETALRLNPFYAEAHNNLGNLLLNLPGRLSEAITQFKTALRLKPDYADARNNLATALLKMPGRSSAAIAQYEAALRIDPDAAEAHYNLANVLVKMPGRLNDAVAEYETAIRIDPDMAEAHTGLGNALLSLPGRLSEAIAQCEAALRIKPDLAEAHNNLGNALLLEPGRLSEAIGEYQKALQLQPDYPDAHYNLGNAFFQLNRFKEAIDEYRIAIKLKPDYAEAHNNLGNALAESGRLPEAVAEYEVALQINPGYENALRDLEQVRQAMAQQAR